MSESKKQQALGDDFKPDLARYRKAREPHESPEAAQKAIDAFTDAITELRVQHRIADLYLVYNACMLEEDGTESSGVGTFALGNQTLWESMAACAYGIERSKSEERIRKLLAGRKEK